MKAVAVDKIWMLLHFEDELVSLYTSCSMVDGLHYFELFRDPVGR